MLPKTVNMLILKILTGIIERIKRVLSIMGSEELQTWQSCHKGVADYQPMHTQKSVIAGLVS